MMKKILILASLATTYAHGMEETPLPDMQVSLLQRIPNKSLSIMFNGTKIDVIKESIFHTNKPIDITFVGNYQQLMVHGHNKQFIPIGNTCPYTISSIHEKNTVDDSASDDDTYHPYPHCIQQPQNNTHIISSTVISIEEPCIRTDKNGFIYQVRKKGEFYPRKEHHNCYSELTYVGDEKFLNLTFKDDAAIKEASSDLVLCYNCCLIRYVIQKKQLFRTKTIAFSTLGSDVGFPRNLAAPIAVETVITFIQDHSESDMYESINFFVKKRSDFALYSRLLLKYYKPTDLMLLLYRIHNRPGNFLSSLPLEVIDLMVLQMALTHNSKNK